MSLCLFCGSFPQDLFSEKGLANDPIAMVTRAADQIGLNPEEVLHHEAFQSRASAACEQPSSEDPHNTYILPEKADSEEEMIFQIPPLQEKVHLT